ncbi:MAG: hypothetical protein AAGE52_17710 [Myxococcota bacterium]
MAKKPKHVVCTHCHLGQERVLKQTFLGFFRFICEECQEENTYPLPPTYVAIYGIAIVASLVSILQGGSRIGILAIGGAIALAYDFNIRRNAKEAQSKERTLGQVVSREFE